MEEIEKAVVNGVSSEISKLKNETNFHIDFIAQLLEHEIEEAIQKMDNLLEDLEEGAKGLESCAGNLSTEISASMKNFSSSVDFCRNSSLTIIHNEFSSVLHDIEGASYVFGNLTHDIAGCNEFHSTLTKLMCKYKIARDVQRAFKSYSANIRHMSLGNLIKAPHAISVASQCVSTAASVAARNIGNILNNSNKKCNPFSHPRH